jgi:hypothetical protein
MEAETVSGQVSLTRRSALVGSGAALLAPLTLHATTGEELLVPMDPPRVELVLNIIVTCGAPEAPAQGNGASKDGTRSQIWPILGGRFFGKGLRGMVVPGGGDFPVTRPDGVEVIDALYRLRTDDGVTILIHNRGLMYPSTQKGLDPQWPRFRLVPEFTAPVGRYDWLNRAVFLSTLGPVPADLLMAKDGQNDRLIQIYRVL